MSPDVTRREVQLRPTRMGVDARVVLRHLERNDDYDRLEPRGSECVGTYRFVRTRSVAEAVDRVRGDLDDVHPAALFYVGSPGRKHYWQSHGLGDVPIDVLEEIAAEEELVEGVEGGWASWDGRPEFSENYVDVSGAAVVDVDEIGAERQEAEA